MNLRGNVAAFADRDLFARFFCALTGVCVFRDVGFGWRLVAVFGLVWCLLGLVLGWIDWWSLSRFDSTCPTQRLGSRARTALRGKNGVWYLSGSRRPFRCIARQMSCSTERVFMTYSQRTDQICVVCCSLEVCVFFLWRLNSTLFLRCCTVNHSRSCSTLHFLHFLYNGNSHVRAEVPSTWPGTPYTPLRLALPWGPLNGCRIIYCNSYIGAILQSWQESIGGFHSCSLFWRADWGWRFRLFLCKKRICQDREKRFFPFRKHSETDVLVVGQLVIWQGDSLLARWSLAWFLFGSCFGSLVGYDVIICNCCEWSAWQAQRHMEEKNSGCGNDVCHWFKMSPR